MWSVVFLLVSSLYLDGLYCVFALTVGFAFFVALFNYSFFPGYLLKTFSLYLDSFSTYFVSLAFVLILLVVCTGFKVGFSAMHKVLSVFLLMVLCLFFTSSDIFSLFMYFEFSFLVVIIFVLCWGANPERVQATSYMVVYTLLGSVPMMLSLILMYYTGEGWSSLYSWFESDYWYNCHARSSFVNYLSFFWLLAFFIKMPVFGFHAWLPKAHVEAPIFGSMLLAGILLKVGVFGALRFMVLAPFVQFKMAQLFLCYFYFGFIVLNFICLRQFDLKAFVAYSSVVHMSLMVLKMGVNGLFSSVGSALLSFAHGLCSAGLFLGVHLIYVLSGTRNILLNRGFLYLLPLQMLLWFLLCVCNCSVPPSMNLISELSLMFNGVAYMDFTHLFYAFNMLASGLFCIYLYMLVGHGKVSSLVKYLSKTNQSTMLHMNSLCHMIPGILYFMFLFSFAGVV